MTCATEKPTRVDALKYYRKTVEHFQLELRLYEAVTKVEGHNEHFIVHTQKENGEKYAYHSRKIVVATGYYDLPNRLNVPGEDLPHVSHYYTEPHSYWEQDVVVVWRKKFRGGGGAGTLSRRFKSNSSSSRLGTRKYN